MVGRLIALIYFYVLSAVSVGILIFATFSWANLIINLTQYDKYPLRYGTENCDFGNPYSRALPYPVIEEGGKSQASLSAEEKETVKKGCLAQVEEERKRNKLDDIKNAVTATIVGVILFLIHFPQAKKLSKEKS